MKRISILSSLVFLVSLISAQTSVDALRYSRIETGGTARFISMGGAFGALGADFTTLSINPAGIAVYRSSEFTITPSIFSGATENTYRGTNSNDYRVNFNLGNIGLVFTKDIFPSSNKSGWKSTHFGIGINRLNDFNNRMELFGAGVNTSLLDVYTSYANNNSINYSDIESDPFYEFAYDLNPAWWTFLMDTLGGPGSYVNPILQPGSSQRMNINSWGSMNEFVISFGGNYNDRLYIGASFGIPYIRYFEESTYTEEFTSETNDMYRFDVNRELETKASGFNFKFGVIGKPANWLRIGGAIHTPTFYSNIRDRNVAVFESRWRTPDLDGRTSYRHSNTWSKTYNLTTPFRAIGSLAFIFGPFGLLSMEYNYVDYSQARFRDVAGYVNDDIKNGYTSTHNFMAGTEWRYDIFSFRLGYAYNSSPYQSGLNDGEKTTYSGGIGINFQKYFLDFAYAYSKYSEDYYLYSYDNITAMSVNDYKGQRFMFTFGARF